MGHQEAYDFRSRKSDNRHYEPQHKIITNGVLIEMTVMVHRDITGRLTTGSGKKSNSITS